MTAIKERRLSEADVRSALRESPLALLEADVSSCCQTFYPLSKKNVGAASIKSVRPDQQVIKIVHDGLVEMLGGDAAPLAVDVAPPL